MTAIFFKSLQIPSNPFGRGTWIIHAQAHSTCGKADIFNGNSRNSPNSACTYGFLLLLFPKQCLHIDCQTTIAWLMFIYLSSLELRLYHTFSQLKCTTSARKPTSMPSTKRTRGTATEHTKQPVVLTANFQTLLEQNEMEEAKAERADDTVEQLAYRLAEFLTYVMRALCCSDLHLSQDA